MKEEKYNQENDDNIGLGVFMLSAAVVYGIYNIAESTIKGALNFFGSNKDIDNSEHIYTKALNEQNKGNYANAIELCYEAIKLNPQSWKTYNLIAWIFAVCEVHLDLAEQNAKYSIEMCDDVNWKATIYDTLGEVYFRRKDYDKSIHYFKESIEIYDKYNVKRPFDTLLRLGESYYYNKPLNLSIAKNIFFDLIEFDESRSLANYYLGEIYLTEEFYDLSFKHFNDAIIRFVDNDIYLDRFRKIAQDRDYVFSWYKLKTYYALSILYFRDKSYKAASILLNKTMKLNINLFINVYVLDCLICYRINGSKDSSIEKINSLIDRLENNEEIRNSAIQLIFLDNTYFDIDFRKLILPKLFNRKLISETFFMQEASKLKSNNNVFNTKMNELIKKHKNGYLIESLDYFVENYSDKLSNIQMKNIRSMRTTLSHYDRQLMLGLIDREEWRKVWQNVNLFIIDLLIEIEEQ